MLIRRIAPLLALLVPSIAAAQAPPPPGMPPVAPQSEQKPTRFGVKAGVNAATLANDLDPSDAGEVLDSETLMTFVVGGVIVHRLNPNVSAMAELLYIRKGSGIDTSGLGIDEAFTTLDYIEAPLVGRYELSPGASFNPFIYGGGALALYLSGEVEVDGESDEIDSDNISSFDVGVVIGAGAEMAAGSGALIFDLRYTHGLIDLDTVDPDDNGGVDFISKSRVISLTGGFLF